MPVGAERICCSEEWLSPVAYFFMPQEKLVWVPVVSTFFLGCVWGAQRHTGASEAPPPALCDWLEGAARALVPSWHFVQVTW